MTVDYGKILKITLIKVIKHVWCEAKYEIIQHRMKTELIPHALCGNITHCGLAKSCLQAT